MVTRLTTYRQESRTAPRGGHNNTYSRTAPPDIERRIAEKAAEVARLLAPSQPPAPPEAVDVAALARAMAAGTKQTDAPKAVVARVAVAAGVTPDALRFGNLPRERAARAVAAWVLWTVLRMSLKGLAEPAGFSTHTGARTAVRRVAEHVAHAAMRSPTTAAA